MAYNNRVLLYRVRCVAYFICSLLLAACGSDDSTVQTARVESEPLDPCALVTETEVVEAMGAQSSESDRPSEANNEYLATCRYVAPRGHQARTLAMKATERLP